MATLPIEQGIADADRCADNAERLTGWDRHAVAEWIVRRLRECGPTSGERLVTDATKLYPPHDARAFGSVFAGLKRHGRIRVAGYQMREKGKGAPGGTIWAIAGPVPADPAVALPGTSAGLLHL